MKIKYLPIILTQLLIFTIGRIFFRLIIAVEYNYSKSKFEKNKKYIFISNHVTKFDPFLIGVYLPFSQLKNILPLRFLTTPVYMKKIHLTLFLKLFGCITTKRKEKYNVLKKSIKLLKDNNTIFIFPTGKLERNDKERKPKVGAIYLHKEVKGSELVLFKIKVNKNSGLRKKLSLNLVGIEKVNNFKKDLEPIMNKIYIKIK